MTRAVRWGSALLLVLLGLPSSARAQVVQSVQFGVGYFSPRGFDGRATGDVWVANLSQPDVLPGVSGSLEFAIGDFRMWNMFGEWNVAFGDRIEASGGTGYYRRTVNSRYRDLVNSARGNADINQDLKLRTIPITGLVRFMPFGKAGSAQPYVGVGVTAVNFRYIESGEFVDPSDFTIFCAGTVGCPNPKYLATGTAVGPVLLGGVRLPVGGDIYAFTIEGRYHMVQGKTGGGASGFLGEKLDLGGFTFNMGVLVRF